MCLMNCFSLDCLQCYYRSQETTCSLAVNMVQVCKQMVSGGCVGGEGGAGKYWNVTQVYIVTAK